MEVVPAELSLVTVKTLRPRPPEIEVEAEAIYPERRLWLAVIVQALSDYEDLLRRVESNWNRLQQPTQRQTYLDVKELQRHMQHPLFQVICDHAGIEASLIHRKVHRLERDYCFNAIPFEDSSEVLSEWQVRQARRKA